MTKWQYFDVFFGTICFGTAFAYFLANAYDMQMQKQQTSGLAAN